MSKRVAWVRVSGPVREGRVVCLERCVGGEFLTQSIATFRSYKSMAERAIAQLDDAQLRQAQHPETNSVAVVMKHMAGNMISRWTDFLTTDGEKASRDRDSEFVDDLPDRAALMAFWERGWATLFATLESLSDDDLAKTVRIRGEAHTVTQAILRQLTHYAYHVGQIVQTARVLVGDGAWETLTVPRGGTKDFNASMGYEVEE